MTRGRWEPRAPPGPQHRLQGPQLLHAGLGASAPCSSAKGCCARGRARLPPGTLTGFLESSTSRMLRFSSGMMPRGSLSCRRWREQGCLRAGAARTLAPLPLPPPDPAGSHRRAQQGRVGEHVCRGAIREPYPHRPRQGACRGPTDPAREERQRPGRPSGGLAALQVEPCRALPGPYSSLQPHFCSQPPQRPRCSPRCPKPCSWGCVTGILYSLSRPTTLKEKVPT